MRVSLSPPRLALAIGDLRRIAIGQYSTHRLQKWQDTNEDGNAIQCGVPTIRFILRNNVRIDELSLKQ